MTSLPPPAGFNDPSELTEALADALREVPLGGPKTKITAEVRAWAEASQFAGPEEQQLDAYNKAAQALPQKLRQELAGMADDPLGRRAVIGLLGFTGASDGVRQLALEALEGKIKHEDVREFARLNLRQRAQVVGGAIRVLARVESAEALFALAKPFAARGEGIGDAATKSAARLEERLVEASYLRSLEQGGDAGESVAEMNGSELLFAALALPAIDQARLLDAEAAGVLAAHLSPPAEALDATLRAGVAPQTSLSPYEMHLRDALFEFILIADLKVPDAVSARARENLFRRDDLAQVRSTAPYLPDDVFAEYASRALTPQMRRGDRKDRALLALELAEQRDTNFRKQLRDTAQDSLTETDPKTRAAAARFLALDEESLPPDLRSQLVEVFDDLPGAERRELGRRLSAVGQSAMSQDAFRHWVESAPPEDRIRRLAALLARWASQPKLPPAQAGELLQTFGEVYARLEAGERERLTEDLVEASAVWLHAQGNRIATSTGPLMQWQRFREVVAGNVEGFAEKLRKTQLSGLLLDALGVRGKEVSPPLVAVVAEQGLSNESARDVVIDVLGQAIAADTEATESAFGQAGVRGRRRLISAGLLESSRAKEALAELQASIEHGTTVALEQKRELLVDALDAAIEASEGNGRLTELFGEIQAAVVGRADGSTQVAGASGLPVRHDDAQEKRAEVAVSDGVDAWRKRAVERYPSVITMNDAGALQLAANAGAVHELVALVRDLDKQAHSKRAAPPADRPIFQSDLRGVLTAAIAAGFLDHDEFVEAVEGGRPELRRAFWELRDSRVQDAGSADGLGESDALAALRAASSDTATSSLLSRLEIATRGLTKLAALRAGEEIDEAQIQSAWELVLQLLVTELRNLETTRESKKRNETQIGASIGEQLALPFAAIEELFFSYFQLRQQLDAAGWKRVTKFELGEARPRSDFDASMYEIEGDDDGTADRLVVKTLGLRYGKERIRKSRIEPVRSRRDDATQEQDRHDDLA